MKQTYRNYTEFFDKPKEVWVQNIAEGPVCMQLPTGNGQWEPIKLPFSRDPYNLTARCPYDSIKNAIDIRRLTMRRPAAIALLTEDEAKVIFAQRAREEQLWKKDENGEYERGEDGKKIPDIEAAMELALEEQRKLMLGQVPGSEETDQLWDPTTNMIKLPPRMTYGPDEEKPKIERVLTDDDIITPRVMGILRYVDTDIPDKEKWPVKRVLGDLKKIPRLKLEDYRYIQRKGYYKSVTSWAEKNIARLEQGENPVDDEAVNE